MNVLDMIEQVVVSACSSEKLGSENFLKAKVTKDLLQVVMRQLNDPTCADDVNEGMERFEACCAATSACLGFLGFFITPVNHQESKEDTKRRQELFAKLLENAEGFQEIMMKGACLVMANEGQGGTIQ